MVLVVFLASLLATPLASGLVYRDALQRDVVPRKRLQWTLGVGIVSFSGFLLPHLFEDELNQAYLHGFKSAPLVAVPFELLALHLLIGITISTVSVLLYRLRVRYGVA